MAKPDRAYYGIVAALPPLPRKGMEGFRPLHLAQSYKDLLDDRDRRTLELAYVQADHTNLLNRLTGSKQFVAGGNLAEDDIQRLVSGDASSWPYLTAFLEEVRTRNLNGQRKETELALARHALTYLITQDNELLREWALVQVRLRLYTNQQAGESLRPVLLQERDVLQDILDQWSASGGAVESLPENLMVIQRQADIFQKEWDTDEWIWEFLEREENLEPFSLNALIGYALRQQICLRRSALLSSKSANLLDHLVGEAVQEFL